MKVFEGAGMLLSIVAFLFSFSVNAVPATPVPEGNLLLQQPSNSSHIDSLLKTDNGLFRYAIEYDDNKPLNSISMLMNAVDALGQLALKNHRDRSGHFHFTLPTYRTVRIDVVTIPPATTFLNEVATLCIYSGMLDVIRKRKYKTVQLTCAWDMVDIMEVFITNPTTAATASNATEPGDPLSATNTTTDAAATTADPILNQLEPRFGYYPYSRRLDVPLTFLTLMYTHVMFSKESATDIVPRCYTDPGPEWDACMIFPADGAIRTRPPYLEYRYVIQTLRQVPSWLIQHGRFAELAIAIWVDNIDLGGAVLLKGKPDQSVGPGLNNASVSQA
ncbi:MAG: hypothetical protein Q9201_000039 [Fulgogasparrea decipioides]